MARQNNTSRSLQIISRMQGWDPSQIEGGPSINAVYHVRETPSSSDTGPIPAETSQLGAMQQNTNVTPDTPPTFHTPILRENEDHKGESGGGDPFAGMGKM